MNMSNEERNRIIRERVRQAADNLEGFEAQLEIKPKPKPTVRWILWSLAWGTWLVVYGAYKTDHWFDEMRASEAFWAGAGALMALTLWAALWLYGFWRLAEGVHGASKRWKARNR